MSIQRLIRATGENLVFKYKGAIHSLWKSDSLFLGVICFTFVLFAMLFPFLCPKQKSKLLFSLFVKDDFRSRHSFNKRAATAICSRCSLQKEWRERFTLWRSEPHRVSKKGSTVLSKIFRFGRSEKMTKNVYFQRRKIVLKKKNFLKAKT